MKIIETDCLVDTSSSDEDLFAAMSLKTEDEKEAQNAFAIFYDRYGKSLWNLCLSVCSKLRIANKEEVAKDIFSNTMMKVYTSASYDSSKAKVTTWLSRIAKNELVNSLRAEVGKPIILDEEILNNFYNNKDQDEEVVLPEKEILNAALDSLTERERHILMTYMLYSDGRKHLPNDVLQGLMEQYETTADNVKHIKSRALAKIKAHIKQNSNLLF